MFNRLTLLTLLLFLLSPLAVQAADISVGTGCTLAQAIESANTDTIPTGSSCVQGDGDDTITIAADITLSAALPAITSNITINGGSNSISGNDARRIFSITGGTVVINNLTMTNGSVSTGNYGGAVSVTGGAATINNGVISNTASGGGGALYVNGSSTTVTVSNSVISDNTISDTVIHGAGIRAEGGATLTITGSSITGNTKTDFAGGSALLFNVNFTVSIANSYIADNSGTKGAAMLISDGNASSSAIVENSTIYNNRALGSSATDAGIRIEDSGGTYTFKHITLSNNFGSAPTAGNQLLVTTSMDTGGSVILANSLLDDAKSGVNDCHVGSGTNFTNAGNLIADGSCSAATSGDPLLGELTGSGAGRHLPLGDTSPAIGAGANDYCDDLSTDQIGTARPTAGCDVGAVESDLTAANVQATATEAQQNVNETATQMQQNANETATQMQQNANETATKVKMDADGTATKVKMDADGTATQVKMDVDGTATQVKNDGQRNAEGTATRAKIDADIAATARVSGARKQEKNAKVKAPLLPTQTATQAATCENIATGVIVRGMAGGNAPQCNFFLVGGDDVVANPEIHAAGGYINAVDIWGWIGTGLEVCFIDQAGGLVFLDAETAPRTIYRIASYGNAQGWTCAFIDRPGTVVLMRENSISPGWSLAPWEPPQALAAAPPPVATAAPASSSSSSPYQALSGCMVRTEYTLYFRVAPGGALAVPQTVPFAVTLTALERAAEWFHVDYYGTRGWISAAHVTPMGTCG